MDPLKRDRSPLPPRAQKELDRKDAETLVMQNRYRLVLRTISTLESVTAIWNLTRFAYAGIQPGSMHWSATSRVLDNERVEDFCGHCLSALVCGEPLACFNGEFGLDCPAVVVTAAQRAVA